MDIHVDEHAFVVQGEWTIMITIDEPQPPSELLTFVHPMEYNKYILVTDGTELALRCAGHTEQTTVVEAGVFEITMAFPCSLHGNNWNLLPTFQRSINVTLSPEDIRLEVNVTIADMFAVHYEHNPMVFGLSEMEAVDRKQLTVSTLSQPVDFHVGNTFSKKLWHSFWVLLLGVPAAGLVYGRRRRRQRHASESPVEIELKTVPAASRPLAAPPSPKAVFTFIGPSTSSDK